MKYPEDYINKIINGDCLEIMKGIPDKSIDLVVTDPPYNMAYAGRGKVNQFVEFANDNLDELEHSKWFDMVLKDLFRVLKDDTAIYVYIDFRNYARIFNLIKQYFEIKNCIVWDKGSIGMGMFYRFQHEFCIYAVKGKPKLYNDKRNFADIWYLKRDNTADYQHPTQKPVSAISLPIQHSSLQGGVILDPFIGSGTTAKAAKDLKRNFIGIEISPEYCAIAEQRLKQQVLPL